MRSLRNMLFLVMAFAWAPITWHCNLEVLPVLDFLACCAHDEADAPHQDSDCDEDGCAVVESGNYKTQDEQIVVLPPQLIGLVPSVSSDTVDEASQSVLATSPPEELHTWQFVLRTALPVRAPSLLS